MKHLILLLIVPVLGISASMAQCCNVFASNGKPVSSSEGNCISLTYSTSDCFTTKLEAVVLDSDRDGITDDVDLCPTVKGDAINKGCPTITVSYYELFKTAIQHVHFETDSDSLDLESTQGLDEVAALLKENKDFNIKLLGFADNEGTNEYNKILSEKRAETVKKYLNNKGIKERRISTAAYGESLPHSSNSTEKGKADNRRVDFHLYY